MLKNVDLKRHPFHIITQDVAIGPHHHLLLVETDRLDRPERYAYGIRRNNYGFWWSMMHPYTDLITNLFTRDELNAVLRDVLSVNNYKTVMHMLDTTDTTVTVAD